MKIAIVGTGISGNVVARKLHREHDITVFEANDYIGGHTNTVDVEWGGAHYAVDTGFIVFNDWTYPHFIALLDELGVESQPSSMSFSVRCERSGLEYNGTTLNSLFAQRRNLLRPAFLGMIRDILRFNRAAIALLERDGDDITLGEYLAANGFGRYFIDYYIIPMGAAIWSTDPLRMFSFPARYFARFLHNHGMLSIDERPRWRVIRGGSRTYVKRLVAPFRDRILTGTPVQSVRREHDRVWIKARGREPEAFDALFLACHSDQALRLLLDADRAEREVLTAIPYQENEAVLHTDPGMMPRRKLAWAAWNYRVPAGDRERIMLTYNMNILQSLDAPVPFMVTLNSSDHIDPRRIIQRITYHHPLYTPRGVAAQARQGDINGRRRTFYCGAYWRNGFHEDGVASALAAIDHFTEFEQHAQLPLRRAG